MPARQPFTSLCSQLAAIRPETRVDLHMHSTYSDGHYAPAQLVDLARRAGVPALALTDHDTLEGVPEMEAAAKPYGIEVVPGVEITVEWNGYELHLLAYFVRLDDEPLQRSLADLRTWRGERFLGMIEQLRARGIMLDLDDVPSGADPSLGRRHLAEMLVKAKRADSVRDAFRRYLADESRFGLPKRRLPIAEALTRVREAGGVASWAHPSYICTRAALAELAGMGLGAVEAEFPSARYGRQRELRTWAKELNLAITGGSDCHGPDQPRRSVGAAGIAWRDLQELRMRARSQRDCILV